MKQNKSPVTVNERQPFFSAGSITVIAILTAISLILYLFVKFPLPFIFPSWLDFQISDLPALLGGFALGPVAGAVIIVLKCCLKMLFGLSSTANVGELADILVGIAFVVPAAIIYSKFRSKKSAIAGLAVGTASAVVVSVLANAFVLIPFYTKSFGMEAIVGMVQALYPNVNGDNFLAYYLPLAVAPFNILRCVLSGVLTYLVYKPLSKALHWNGKVHRKPSDADNGDNKSDATGVDCTDNK